MQNIFVLGAGNMGGAIIFGLRKKFGAIRLKPVEINVDRSAYFTACGFEVSKNITNIDSNDIVVIAVPPHNFQCAVRDNPLLRSHGGPVISVMAGITAKLLYETLGDIRLIRSIPNTPSEVHEGITVYYAREDADSDLIAAAEMIFGAIGEYIRVDDESQIDSGTALAGGGPALVAYFANALQMYAEDEGFDCETAWKISTQLLFGTSMLLRSTGKASMQLCKEVQTSGGTTERAIHVFDQNDLSGIISSALTAAAKHSVELGSSFSVKGLI